LVFQRADVGQGRAWLQAIPSLEAEGWDRHRESQPLGPSRPFVKTQQRTNKVFVFFVQDYALLASLARLLVVVVCVFLPSERADCVAHRLEQVIAESWARKARTYAVVPRREPECTCILAPVSLNVHEAALEGQRATRQQHALTIDGLPRKTVVSLRWILAFRQRNERPSEELQNGVMRTPSSAATLAEKTLPKRSYYELRPCRQTGDPVPYD
jgi:hypothetical protein